MDKKLINKITLSAMFFALGIVLPFLSMQIPEIGNMLCPMHFPVLLCGFVCGPVFGLIVGFVVPLLRSVLFGMPPMMPTALAMAFELAAYGFMTGILYHTFRQVKWRSYIALILSMITGRIVWGVVMYVLMQTLGQTFTWQLYITGAFVNAIPGIILQILLIPAIVLSIEAVTSRRAIE